MYGLRHIRNTNIINKTNSTNNGIKSMPGKDSNVPGMLKEMLKGTLPCLLLFVVVAVGGEGERALAGSETFLPSREISLSGTVTAPSCQVKLEEEQLNFSRQTGGNDMQVQTLHLRLSECDANGIGMTFTATHWPDMPERGVLQEENSGAYATRWYYTISPQDSPEDEWPLTLAPDSPAPRQVTGRNKTDAQAYFSLDRVNYWYDMKAPLKTGDMLVIPFAVTVRHDDTQRAELTEDDLEAKFTVQLSWR